MAKKAKLNIYTAALAVATALLVTFFKISPIYILLVAGCVFVLPMYIKQYREQMHKNCRDNKYDKEDGGMKS